MTKILPLVIAFATIVAGWATFSVRLDAIAPVVAKHDQYLAENAVRLATVERQGQECDARLAKQEQAADVDRREIARTLESLRNGMGNIQIDLARMSAAQVSAAQVSAAQVSAAQARGGR